VKLRFACPGCGCPGKIASPWRAGWRCPACGHRLTIDPGTEATGLAECALCRCSELYQKKDFPHGLGMAILTVACLVSFITYGLYEKWLTWAILIGTALFDGLLYLWVGDAIVCYRCHAHYRGAMPGAAIGPFDLGLAERFRQERIRRDQLEAARRASG